MVRLRVHDPSTTLELVAFLRRCQCNVQHLGPTTVGVGLGHAVDLEAAVRRVQTGLCYSCGELIEEALFRLGSARCHDCRESSGEHRHREGAQERWTRMEVEAYLRIWRAQNPDAHVELVA
jgi:hypothetical protein